MQRFVRRHLSSDALWTSTIWGPNAHTASLHRDNCSPAQFIPILRQYLLADRALLPRAYVDQADDAAVREASSDRQFAEIFIQRNERALFALRLGQDVFIVRVFGQITCPQDVVGSCLEVSLGTASNAGIEQQLHAADSILRNSIRSWPTMRRA